MGIVIIATGVASKNLMGQDQEEGQRQVVSKVVNRVVMDGGGHFMDDKDNNYA
jgi:hypothetical protein